MGETNLQEEQEPLKNEYEENPDAAQITLTAAGEEQDDVRACNVDIGRAIYEAELHEGAGGPGAAACSGDLDLRGTMGIDDDVPVGFEDIHLDVSVDGEIDEDTQAALQKYTERYCVVYQTLENPPGVDATWTFREESE